jgi:glutamate 5-kinase
MSIKKRIVVKIGTSTLTVGTNVISRGKMEDIARQIIELQEEYDVILISSGAIAAAKQFDKLLVLGTSDDLVTSKQALSAIGQPKLMQMYNEVFTDFGLNIAQCLVTHHDFDNPDSRNHTFNTITTLLAHQYIPIINENDTVAIEELDILGDNDTLSALVAVLVDAQKLIIASDINGIYDSNPHTNPDAELIKEINDVEDVKPFIEELSGGLGTGGMTTKIKAMEICEGHNIEVYIVNGSTEFFIKKTLEKDMPYTKFPNT